MKEKINGGCGEDDNMSAFYDFIYTANLARAYLWVQTEGGHKITIISNQKVQDACKKNITQFAFPKDFVPIKKFNTTKYGKHRYSYYFVPGNIDLELYWVNEFDWLMKLDWVKEWKIKEKMKDILTFENILGKQMKTGLLTL